MRTRGVRRGGIMIGIASALALVAIGSADVAEAQHHGHGDRGGWSDRSDRGGYDRPPAYDRLSDGDRDRGDPRQDERGRRTRCRGPGTDGTIIGAIAGGLLGGGNGAPAGRAIDRGC